MTRRRLVVLGVVAVLLGFLGRGYFRAPPSDDDQIRAIVAAVADAAGEADVDGCVAPLSPAYAADDFGGLDRRAVTGFLYLQFRKYGPAAVVLGPIAVDVRGEEATATFDATLMSWGPKGGGLLPENADAWHMVVDFAREEGEWRIVHHRRESASGR